MKSRHLQRILRKENQIAHMQVVFCDVQLYSKRNSHTMIQIVNKLNELLKSCLLELQQTFAEYLDNNDLLLVRDVITLPTGDGAATVFTFSGLHDIHVAYAETLLAKTLQLQQKPRCDRFDKQGWCNCHPYMNLRIGVSEGRGIIYEDLNGRFNVAGEAVNMASRAMSIARPNQIVLTDNAYKELMDLTADTKISLDFEEIKDAVVKHGTKITVYAYRRTRPVRRFNENTLIDWEVNADIEVDGKLVVGNKAAIHGNIAAKDVIVCGSVTGDITATGRLEIRSRCILVGDIKTAHMTIEEGATFIGKSQIVSGFPKIPHGGTRF